MSYIINRTNDGDAIRLFLEKEIVEVMYKKIFTLILSIALIAWELLGAAIVVIGLLYYNYNTSLEEKLEK